MKTIPKLKTQPVILVILIALALFSWPVAAIAQEVYDVNVVEEPNLEQEYQIPGRIEGTGTYFEVNDSNYLNITLESSEPVHLILESVLEMVVMDINAANDATSAEITLGGFLPSTTYYKYEDDYHNLETFTTDENGSYTYAQDLTEPHLVFIQPRASTIFLSDSGWSDPTVGIWDPCTQTGTLIMDVYETIQIDSDAITLDGAGYTVTGTGTGHGIYLYKRTGVSVKNVNVHGFSYGMYLRESNNNTVTDNAASNNYSYGIVLSGPGLLTSSDNTLTGNTASNNHRGIGLYGGSGNTLTGNTANANNGYGIYLIGSSDNTLTGNTANANNRWGINLYNSSNNTLTGNTAYNNEMGGIRVGRYSYHTTLTDNTVLDNRVYGIWLGGLWQILTGNTMSGSPYNLWLVYPDPSNEIDTSNTVDGKPAYYVKDAVGQVYDSSTNAGVFYGFDCLPA